MGNDSFASESLPGQEVRITAVSQLSNYADFSLCKPIDNKAMELTWYISQEDECKVSGFKIYRSNSPDGQINGQIKDDNQLFEYFNDVLEYAKKQL